MFSLRRPSRAFPKGTDWIPLSPPLPRYQFRFDQGHLLAELAFWVCGLPPPERGEDVGWGGTGAAATLSTGAGPVMPGIAAVVGRVTGRDEKPGCHRSG